MSSLPLRLCGFGLLEFGIGMLLRLQVQSVGFESILNWEQSTHLSPEEIQQFAGGMKPFRDPDEAKKWNDWLTKSAPLPTP